MHIDGTKILDAWDRAAVLAITQFCEEQPIFTSYYLMVAFPVTD